jgi:hypothetical protein
MRNRFLVVLVAGVSLVSGSAFAEEIPTSATVGSGGSAAAGNTSASTVGTGGTSQDADGNQSSSIASGGSAAAADGKARSDTKTVENPNQLKSQSKAMAQDKGTFSRSQTKTRVRDDALTSTTRSMSHVPGEKPVKSTTNVEIQP